MKAGFEFLPAMIVVMILAFIGVSFFMRMLIHSSLMYEDKKNLKRDSVIRFLAVWECCGF